MTDSPKNQPRKPLSLKQALSTETLAQIAVLKGKSVFDSPTLSGNKNDKESLSKSISEVGSKNPPLTENELIQIRQKEEYIDRAFNILKERFSNTFALDPAKPIQAYRDSIYELLKGELSKTVIGRALKKYTRSEEYHKAVLASDKRYDIEGNIIGTITPAQKAYAKAALERIEKKSLRNSS